MIKVIHKSFGLLEFIAERDGRPVLPLEAAKFLGLNQATTVRILKDLLELGYLEQISRNKGYVLGPMARSVFSRCRYRERLARVAAAPLGRVAAEIGQSVLVAVIQGARRYVLLHENHNPDMNIDVGALCYKDIYITATGRTLLAHVEKRELDAIVRGIGLPTAAVWPEAAARDGLDAALEKIRRDGELHYRNPFSDLYVMAFPLMEKGFPVAALGASLPANAIDAKKEKTLNAVRELAKTINAKLETLTEYIG